MSNFAEILNTIETNRAALIALQTSGKMSGYVIACGPLFIRIADSKTIACGVMQATKFADRAKAQRLAARIQNGAGVVGHAVTLQDAVTSELASNTAALDAFREALAQQAQA